MIVLAERMQQILALSLSSGSHADFEKGMCVMEAAAYVAGEPGREAMKKYLRSMTKVASRALPARIAQLEAALRRLRNGNDITVTVLGVKGNQVRLGINAPKETSVDREELRAKKDAEKGVA